MTPGVLAPSFALTVVFFLPAHIAEIKGWRLIDVAGSYWAYAASAVLASAVSGFAIDRMSARALLPVFLLPMGLGLWMLAQSASPAAFLSALALMGLTAGATATIAGALWAELYGTRHLGAIRALTHAAMVVSAAAGPGVAGALLDAGVAFERQCLVAAAYCGVVSALFAPLSRRLRRI